MRSPKLHEFVMKIAVAQIDTPAERVDANLSMLFEYARKAKEEHCDLVVFPEMMDTGYNMAKIRETASTWDDKPFHAASRAASDHGLYLICNLSERCGDRIYNSTAVFSPQGRLLGKYRKIHLADYDPLYEGSTITPGERLETVSMGGMSFGLLTCYDLRFPEMSRALTLGGAKALILCSAWPFPRLPHLSTLIRARAIENQVYLIACNRVGREEGLTFCGSSCIVDPYGVIVSAAAEVGEFLITGHVDPRSIDRVRSKMPVLLHRRPVDEQGLKNTGGPY